MSDKNYWFKQSTKFDLAADYYDKYRPGYPDELIEKIISESGVTRESNILEIGAGSGKATEQFVKKGLPMICIEPGENLVAKGKKKFAFNDVIYHQSRFENWHGQDNYYDLILSAQAFHWVQQPEGYEKCARILKDDKKLAIFWNYYTTNGSDVDKELIAFLEKYPFMYISKKEEIDKRIESTVNEIHASSVFSEPEVYKHHWETTYTVDDYIGFIKTSNGYISMSDEDKSHVEKTVREILSRHSDQIVRPFVCVCYMMKKIS